MKIIYTHLPNTKISSYKYYITFDTLTDASPYIVTEEIPVLHICGFHNHSCVSSGFCFKSFSLFFKLCSFLRYYRIVVISTVHAISFQNNGLYNFDGCLLVHCCNVSTKRLSIKIWRVNGNILSIKVKM